MNKESWMRGQQTYPLTIHFNTWTISSDVSIQRRHWKPLSVRLWAYCTHPTHDVNDVMCEGWPHHRGLRPLLFSNSGVGSFTSHKNKSVKVLWDGTYGFSSLSEKTRKSNHLQMSLQRQHFLLSYFKDPECWSGRGSNPWPPAQQTGALPTEQTSRRFMHETNQNVIWVDL